MGIGDKLRSLVGRKAAASRDEDDLDADDELSDGETEGAPEADAAGEPDGDAGPDDEDDDLEPEPRRRRWVPIAFAGGSAAGLVGVVVAGWLVASMAPGLDHIPRVTRDLPPRGGPVESLMAEAPVPAALTPAAPRTDQKPAGAAAPSPAAPAISGDKGPSGQVAANPAADTPGGGTILSPVTVAAYAGLPARPAAKPLGEAPDPALVEQGPDGALPKTAGKREPWRAYAAPSASAKGGRVAILVEGLGLSRIETEMAIDRLAGPISLSFSPYASDLAAWNVRSRQNGHETFLGLPMESERFPIRDPGPLALLTSVSAADNGKKLEAVLARGTGYVGVSSLMGERFLATQQQVRPLLEALKARGLAFVDTNPDGRSVIDKIRQDLPAPVVRARVRLDDAPSRADIDVRLGELEAAARKDGKALGVCRPYPVTLDRLANWVRTLEGKGVTLVPVSALIEEAKTP